jgi:thymidylate synthase (FAD)
MIGLEPVKVLDHGYVKLVETWGSDARIIEAARMSTDKGFGGWGGHLQKYTCDRCGQDLLPETEVADGEVHAGPQFFTQCGGTWRKVYAPPGDEKLLRYLWKNKHATPFEMAGATFEVQAPLFLVREWERHRVLAAAHMSYNEFSARYSELPDLYYVPSVERLTQPHSSTNRQAQGTQEVTAALAQDARNLIEKLNGEARLAYRRMLDSGVPRELARLVVPVNQYTKMRVTANLRNWLAFLTLRDHSHAQWEIQQYAGTVSSLLGGRFPRTHHLWQEEQHA